MPNYNEKTGIPYGVISGNNVPDLADNIFSAGENLSFQGYKKDLAEKIKGAIVGAISDSSFHPEKVVEGLDIADIVETLMDNGLGDDYQGEEEEYSYSYDTPNGKVSLLLGWLGGASIIWVIDSPWFANTAHCSPCVPGAGDLDSPVENGLECYCLPPDDMPEEWAGKAQLIADNPAPDCADERAGREPYQS